MKKPPFPSNEAARALSLHKLKILDTPAEEPLDRITRMAQRLFEVDICLISLVDSHRQWFKSRQGLDATETPREISFCGHTILSNEIMVVEDTLHDPRFADNPLVTGAPDIRFYAGFPIYSPEKYAVGTLCLIHPKPRKLSAEDRESLRDMAGMVEDRLRLSVDATVDKLTQVSNRRGFEIVASQILSVCKRENTEAQLLFFDLDGLKTVNDDLGHGAGDDILRRFGKILKLCFRESDLIARVGGDEFVVLLSGENINANAALGRLTNAAEIASSDQEPSLQWSVGIAQYDPLRHPMVSDLMSEADTRMYEDKRKRKLLRK